MSGRKSWREIRKKRRDDPERERERRREQEAYSRAYDVVRPVVALSERTGNEGVCAEDLARVLGADDPEALALLAHLARATEELGGRLEVRLVFPDIPKPDVAAVRLHPAPEPDPPTAR